MKELVVGTAGHIDHGKTALVQALTGVNTDRLPAEKLRGISIDLGFAALKLGQHALSLVDVPGHERFIRNMLAGASGIDLALLVVAADDSVMPQTREHLELLSLLGLSSGIVALTKCDLADPAWLDLVEQEVRDLIAGTFLQSAPIIRTSSVSRLGIDRLREGLVEVCDRLQSRPDPGPFRMAIDRAFSIPGHGTVVTGSVLSGTLSVGEEVEWWPSGRRLKIRGLHQHDQKVERVGRGARAGVNLAGLSLQEVERGQEIAQPGYLVPTRRLSVEVRASEPNDVSRPLRHRGRYRLHLGTSEVGATLGILEPDGDPLAPILAQLSLDRPVVAVSGQPFVLRQFSPAATVGGGRILEPNPPRHRRRDLASMERLRLAASGDPRHRLLAAVGSLGLSGWTELALTRETALPLKEVQSTLASLRSDGSLGELSVGPRRRALLAASTVETLEGRVLRALGRLHDARPRQSAIRQAHILVELPDVPEAAIHSLIDRLKKKGAVVADGPTIALSGRKPRLSHTEKALKDQAEQAIKAGGYQPPDLAALKAQAGARAPVLPDLLTLLIE
ncbi:MAG TPA: selenocysteine-specific translation elongation factor, partial [Isosphaeraceae bacterium]|nr:selenocysteine-specific translation elongation factor [Isosphaeraceae bacterium]